MPEGEETDSYLQFLLVVQGPIILGVFSDSLPTVFGKTVLRSTGYSWWWSPAMSFSGIWAQGFLWEMRKGILSSKIISPIWSGGMIYYLFLCPLMANTECGPWEPVSKCYVKKWMEKWIDQSWESSSKCFWADIYSHHCLPAISWLPMDSHSHKSLIEKWVGMFVQNFSFLIIGANMCPVSRSHRHSGFPALH